MAEYAIGGLTPEQRHDLEDALRRRSIEADWHDTTVAVPDAAAYVVTGLVDQARRGALAGAPLPPPPNPYAAAPPPAGYAVPLGPGGTGGPAPYAGMGPAGYPAPGYPPAAGMGAGGYGPPGGYPPPGAYGGYGGPGYVGGGYAGAYGPPARRSNGMAIASLIMSLLAFVICPILAIGGLICGYKGRSFARDNGGEGAGLAMAGIIIGWAGVAVGIAAIFVYGGMLAFFVASPTTSSSLQYPPPITAPRSPTIPRGTTIPFGTTVPRSPGSVVPPSGVIPIEACNRVTLAFRNLTVVKNPDRGILADAANTLHSYLPASSSDDIDTLLGDDLPRVGRDDTGPAPQAVLDAGARLQAVIADACPN